MSLVSLGSASFESHSASPFTVHASAWLKTQDPCPLCTFVTFAVCASFHPHVIHVATDAYDLTGIDFARDWGVGIGLGGAVFHFCGGRGGGGGAAAGKTGKSGGQDGDAGGSGGRFLSLCLFLSRGDRRGEPGGSEWG